VAAVGEQHLERSKLVLLGLTSKDAEETTSSEWHFERELASRLLADTRLYRQAAEEQGLATMAGVMRDLEFVLHPDLDDRRARRLRAVADPAGHPQARPAAQDGRGRTRAIEEEQDIIMASMATRVVHPGVLDRRRGKRSGVGARPMPESQRLERAKDLIAEEQWLRAITELQAAAEDPKERDKDEALFWLAHSQNQMPGSSSRRSRRSAGSRRGTPRAAG
jgi:hypothetical protein